MRLSLFLSNLIQRFSQMRGDERAAIAIYVALSLPLLLGGAVLAIDASRVYNNHTFLQKGADALALAAAAELDRSPTALTRANGAINNLVTNDHRFSDAGLTQVNVASVRFLSSLPADDSIAIGSALETSDPLIARFVEVTVSTQTITALFPIAALGGAQSATATARAVAGFDAAVCQFTPMFMCNPFEGSGMSIFEAMRDPAIRRRQIVLRKKGGSEAQYSAGNYGFLQPANGQHGANVIRDMLALTSPPACFIQNGVSLRPGFIASADQGLNVRFDMYDGPFNSQKGNSDYRPARNVRKGYGDSGNACQASPAPPNQALPDDTCFATDSCPYMGGRMGDGNWDVDGYKLANNLGGLPFSNAAPPSRHEVYRYEIDNNLVGTSSQGGEVGGPQCYSGGTLNDAPDRRLL
ncbi:MAG: pilus assembly protein TadG-related protein, partial [Hyphomicrobiaceae bacterium]